MARTARFPAVTLAALLLLLIPLATSAQAHKKAVVGPGDSIQAAIDAAKPGDRILVSGLHRENVAITKDGIELRGLDAVLEPPATPAQNACFDPSAPQGLNGICVLGDGNFDTGEVITPVKDVTVRGFTIRGFDASGIFAFGAADATFRNNVAENDGEYGIVAFASTGTRMLFNTASGAGEAGLYVGDSPNADATLIGNETFDNLFGVFIRNAEHGKVINNSAHDNCVGMLVLADAPGPAGFFRFNSNSISHNTKVCLTEEDVPTSISGIGLLLSGATNNSINGNLITGNVPGGETFGSGGVVLATADGGTPPTDNKVRGNRLLDNDPDIFWDETGSGNTFKGNNCDTSSPAGLCH
jgi:parallel beta-helix repeat protein